MTPAILLRNLGHATLWPADDNGCAHARCADVRAAYQLALEVRQQTIEREEQPQSFKIGFTTRSIGCAFPDEQSYGRPTSAP